MIHRKPTDCFNKVCQLQPKGTKTIQERGKKKRNLIPKLLLAGIKTGKGCSFANRKEKKKWLSVKTKSQKSMPRATENHFQGKGLSSDQWTGDICLAGIQNCHRPYWLCTSCFIPLWMEMYTVDILRLCQYCMLAIWEGGEGSGRFDKFVSNSQMFRSKGMTLYLRKSHTSNFISIWIWFR